MLIRNLTIAALCVYAFTLMLFLAFGLRSINGLTAAARGARAAHSIGMRARSIRPLFEGISRGGVITKELRARLTKELAGAGNQVDELATELSKASVPREVKETALNASRSWKRFSTGAAALLGAKEPSPGAASGSVRELTAFDSSLDSLAALLDGALSLASARHRKDHIMSAAAIFIAWSLIGAFILLRVALPLSAIAQKVRGAPPSGDAPVSGAGYSSELSSITGYIDSVSMSLKEASASYRMFEEILMCPVIELDATGTVVFMNARAERITGYSLQELRGKDFSGLVPAQTHAAFLDFFSRTIHGEAIIACESSLIFENGEVKPVVFNAVPLFTDARAPGCLISFGDASDKDAVHELELYKKEAVSLRKSSSRPQGSLKSSPSWP